MLSKKHSRVDVAGMALSFVCLLHCALLPALIVGGMLAGDTALLGTAASEWTHVLMLGLIVPISGLALAGGWWRHRRSGVVALGLFSIALLAFAAFYAHEHLGRTADAVITSTGGVLLAIAHWRNRDCACTAQASPRPA